MRVNILLHSCHVHVFGLRFFVLLWSLGGLTSVLEWMVIF